MQNSSVIIMAGGYGKRMNSTLPKVLHKVGEYPMLVRIIKTVLSIRFLNKIFIIVGKHEEEIKQTVSTYFPEKKLKTISYVTQEEPCGTGHAVQCVFKELSQLSENENIIILSGDTPLISVSTIEILIQTMYSRKVAVMVRKTENPCGLGRIVTSSRTHRFERIVEEKDATEEERKITTVNCGVYGIKAGLIVNHIFELKNENAQKEYYLTDLIGILRAKEIGVDLVNLPPYRDFELLGVNTPQELDFLNSILEKSETGDARS